MLPLICLADPAILALSLAGAYLESSIALTNHGTLSLCNAGHLRIGRGLEQTSSDAVVELCRKGRISVLPSAPAGTKVDLRSGKLKGGGTIDGNLEAGCVVTFQDAVGDALTVTGSLQASVSFALTVRIDLVNTHPAQKTNWTQSAFDAMHVVGTAVFRGSVTTAWTWKSGPKTFELVDKPSFGIVSYGSGKGVINETSFSTTGVDANALRRREVAGVMSVEFMGCQSGYKGTELCTPCPKGSFSQRTSDSLPLECAACSPGQYQDLEGQTSCRHCSPGTHAASSGFAACDKCDPGYYEDEHGSLSCDACSPGHYSNEIAATQCSDCDAGFYAPSNASSTCLPCPAGQYQPSRGSSVCMNCSEGYESYGGNANCVKTQPPSTTAAPQTTAAPRTTAAPQTTPAP